ncbi:MAG: rhomboid family intramembrane serine protease [Flavobacteriia bacterium]|nr:rhomboid family intramembrane serine protease [Flavobacteriia bacterium]
MIQLSSLWVILAITVFISYQGFNRTRWREQFLFSPYDVSQGNSFQGIFTHSWFHADWQHLLFNMFSFYALGSYLEQVWMNAFGSVLGSVYFVSLYLLGGIAATVIPFFRHRREVQYRSLGASGAVSAVIFACILWTPDLPLYVFFIPIAIPAYIFGPIYLAIEFYAMKRGKSNIANDGHLSGALFGLLFVLTLAPHKGMDFLHLIFK